MLYNPFIKPDYKSRTTYFSILILYIFRLDRAILPGNDRACKCKSYAVAVTLIILSLIETLKYMLYIISSYPAS